MHRIGVLAFEGDYWRMLHGRTAPVGPSGFSVLRSFWEDLQQLIFVHVSLSTFTSQIQLTADINNPICQCLRWLAWLALALPNVGHCPLCCSWLSPEDRRDLASWQLAMLILFSKIWVDSSLEPVCGVTLRVQAGLWGRSVKVHNSVHSPHHPPGYNLVLRTRCRNEWWATSTRQRRKSWPPPQSETHKNKCAS